MSNEQFFRMARRKQYERYDKMMMTRKPLLCRKLTYRARLVKSCLNKTTVRSLNSDTSYWLQTINILSLPLNDLWWTKKHKYQYGMTSIPLLTITTLMRSWLTRRWPLYLWGGHDEHATNYYSSDAVITSTPPTIIPLRRSWRAHR